MNDYFYFKVKKTGVTHGALTYKTDKIYKVSRDQLGISFWPNPHCIDELSPVDAVAAGASAIDVFESEAAARKPTVS